MPITDVNFNTIKGLNPTLVMGLYPDRNGVDKNRIIVWNKPSTSPITIVTGGVNMSGVQFMQGFKSYKNMSALTIITPTLT